MSTKMKEFGIDRLSREDRLALLEEIWESLRVEPGQSYLTDEKRRELKKRLAEHEANPDDVVPWEQVKAEALARFEEK
jgi:putative addiction module component (TIGR02574 family)